MYKLCDVTHEEIRRHMEAIVPRSAQRRYRDNTASLSHSSPWSGGFVNNGKEKAKGKYAPVFKNNRTPANKWLTATKRNLQRRRHTNLLKSSGAYPRNNRLRPVTNPTRLAATIVTLCTIVRCQTMDFRSVLKWRRNLGGGDEKLGEGEEG